MEMILLAVDGSDHSRRAAWLAGELSAALDARVLVVNVVSDRTMLTPATAGAILEYARIEKVAITQREIMQAFGADRVEEAAKLVRDAGGQVDDTEVLVGAPAQEIARLADDRGVDCVVMGRRGLGDAGGLLMGSVSHKVGHLTPRTLVTTE